MKKLFVFPFLVGAICFFYFVFVTPNINGRHVAINIPTGSTYKDVLQILKENQVLKNEFSFTLVSKMKNYSNKVKAGHYVFEKYMNNRQIVNRLSLGLQIPVTLVIYNIRTKEEFAGLVGKTLELESN